MARTSSRDHNLGPDVGAALWLPYVLVLGKTCHSLPVKPNVGESQRVQSTLGWDRFSGRQRQNIETPAPSLSPRHVNGEGAFFRGSGPVKKSTHPHWCQSSWSPKSLGRSPMKTVTIRVLSAMQQVSAAGVQLVQSAPSRFLTTLCTTHDKKRRVELQFRKDALL